MPVKQSRACASAGARARWDRQTEGGGKLRTLTRTLIDRDTRTRTRHVCSERMRMDGDREADTQATHGRPLRNLGVAPSAGTLVPSTRQDQVPSAVLPGSTKTVPGATR